MSSSSNRILSLYKSRITILEYMEELKYDVDEYNNFSINEIDAMFASNQLDMIVKHNTNDTKMYIMYHIFSFKSAKQLRPQTLDEITEELYDIENVLTKNDTLIIIIDDEPNDTIRNKTKYMFEKYGIFVVIHNIKRLQFNLLKHIWQPKVKILETVETAQLLDKYNLKSVSQLPEISRYDPLALAIALRPNQVVELLRSSQTALETKFYRVCV
jgi:DNA-directed RNA polymerase subunit H (RpoH/RPB5)